MGSHTQQWANLYFVVHDLGNGILKKIEDYETKVHNNSTFKKDFYNIEFVYMHSILLDFAKLISATGSDRTGIKQLKKGASKDITERINQLENTYEGLFSKVKANRNKIIAHVDISENYSYSKLGFSQIEIDRKIADLKRYSQLTGDSVAIPQIVKDLENLKSSSSEGERYSPSDFYDDLDNFKVATNNILKIADDLNLYLYTQIQSLDVK